MKKIVGMLLAVLLLAGCGGRAGTGLGGTVNTDGSTSMADVMAALQEAFREKESGVTVNYSGTGSGSGIEAALRGTCDIGLSSRELKEEEKAQGAVGHTVALDGVAVIVNPLNPISDLTVEELALIFTGEISSWSQLGGGAGPIAVYGREAGSGTRGAFEELVGVTALQKRESDLVMDGCEPPCGCWDLNSGPLEEQ
ncbi:MAG: solute-binding protein, partial [Oscillospiraceae bacterium]|nr:solute-binding protein [Oscillospiraceae bacterium]